MSGPIRSRPDAQPYISSQVLKTIVEKNKLGTFIRPDNFTEKGINVRFPRIRINMDIKEICSDKVVIPDGDDEGGVKIYKVWFEEFPKGCGNCELLDHLFGECPLLNLSFKPVKLTLPKGLNPRTNDGKPRYADKEEDTEGWRKVKKRHGRFGVANDTPRGAERSTKQFFQVEFFSSSSNSHSKESRSSAPSVKVTCHTPPDKMNETSAPGKTTKENENLEAEQNPPKDNNDSDAEETTQVDEKVKGPMIANSQDDKAKENNIIEDMNEEEEDDLMDDGGGYGHGRGRGSSDCVTHQRTTRPE